MTEPITVAEALKALRMLKACDKASPGPWHIGSLPPAGWRYICDSKGETLAAVAEWDEDGTLHLEFPNAKANARLIVAARAVLPGMVEYVAHCLTFWAGSKHAEPLITPQHPHYIAIAPDRKSVV